MATPNQSQALYELSQIFNGDFWARHDFESRACIVTFGYSGRGLGTQWRFNPTNDMLDVQLFGHRSIVDNLDVSILREAVGIAPERYCIFFHRGPEFYSKLKLLMTSLPQEKMFLYPATARLEGPFLHEPWLSRGRAIRARPSLTYEEYHANFVLPYR